MNNIVASYEITDQTEIFQRMQFWFPQALFIAQYTIARQSFSEWALHPLDIIN